MPRKSPRNARTRIPVAPTPTRPSPISSLRSDATKGLSETRLRDLRSAVKRVAMLLEDDPARIPLDLPVISAKLAAITPAALGLTPKTFSNIRTNFMAAVKASGLKSAGPSARTPLSPKWKKLFAKLRARRAHLGLSRLARHGSAKGIAPEQINDAAIEAFITEVRNGTLHRKPNDLHRKVALIWNEVARRSELGLQPVTVPSFRSPAKRIDWNAPSPHVPQGPSRLSPLVRRAIRSRPTPVHARWRPGPSSCARIRFTRLPPHLWRAASRRMPSHAWPISSLRRISNEFCGAATKWSAAAKMCSTTTLLELSSKSHANGSKSMR